MDRPLLGKRLRPTEISIKHLDPFYQRPGSFDMTRQVQKMYRVPQPLIMSKFRLRRDHGGYCHDWRRVAMAEAAARDVHNNQVRRVYNIDKSKDPVSDLQVFACCNTIRDHLIVVKMRTFPRKKIK